MHDDPIDALRRAARRAPNDPAVQLRLAGAYAAAGDFARAADACRRAADLDPRSVAAHANLGVCLARLGRHDQAIAAFTRALDLPGADPATLLTNIGLSLHAVGRHTDAVAAYDRALAQAPDLAEAHEYRGLTLAALGRYAEAVAAHRRSLELRPDRPTAWNNLGAALQKVGTDPTAAADAFRRAVALAPDYADAHNNLGTALLDLARPPAESLPHYDRAIALAPDRADFRLNRALALLAARDYARAWPEHEHRLRRPDHAMHYDLLRHPAWDGSAIPGKTLLVHAEQGFGDTLQFARFLPGAARRSQCKFLVQCQPGLERLLRASFPDFTVLARTDPLPAFDFQLPLLSLPAVFGTTLDTLPAAVPYLTPPADLVADWRSRVMEAAGNRPHVKRVFLTWAGSSTDPLRAIPPDRLAPLLALPEAHFFSLESLPGVTSLRPDDFADTAAILMNMDLVITIDTATAHLAGALGRPTHVLLRFAADWRWALAADTTPWYPTSTLHRQPSPNDWAGAIAHLLSHLSR